MILDDELREAHESCAAFGGGFLVAALVATMFGTLLLSGEQACVVPTACASVVALGCGVTVLKARRVILKERNERRLKAMQKQLDEEIGK